MESSATRGLYQVIDISTTDGPIPSSPSSSSSGASPMAKKEVILKIPGAILHLIDKSDSFELASGDLEIILHVQGEITVAVFARVADNIQWLLTKDEPAVKVDESHYLFLDSSNNEGDILNYGLTIDWKGQDPLLLEELDRILREYNGFTVEEKPKVLDLTAAIETSSEELKGERKAMVEDCTVL